MLLMLLPWQAAFSSEQIFSPPSAISTVPLYRIDELSLLGGSCFTSQPPVVSAVRQHWFVPCRSTVQMTIARSCNVLMSNNNLVCSSIEAQPMEVKRNASNDIVPAEPADAIITDALT